MEDNKNWVSDLKDMAHGTVNDEKFIKINFKYVMEKLGTVLNCTNSRKGMAGMCWRIAGKIHNWKLFYSEERELCSVSMPKILKHQDTIESKC